MTDFKVGDIAVIVAGTVPPRAEPEDEYDVDWDSKTRWHYLREGTLVTVEHDAGPDRHDRYIVRPLDSEPPEVWTDGRGEDTGQDVCPEHIAPVSTNLTTTSVEAFLNGTTELVGGLIQTPSNNPLNGNE